MGLMPATGSRERQSYFQGNSEGCSFPEVGDHYLSDGRRSVCFNRDSTTLYVGGSGPGNFSSIQTAINAAGNGDTVFVYDDSSPYYENVVVDKTILLVGESPQTTIIDGSGIGDTIRLSASGVTVKWFTIQHSGSVWGTAGVDLGSDTNTLRGNIIQNCGYIGVFIEGSEHNIISENTIINSGRGIRLRASSHNIINGNLIVNNTAIGICITTISNNNVIYHNTLLGNTPQNAYDECMNSWNQSFPVGGNYYSDYEER
jgi:parallel beta-helix repeat protein